VNWWLIYLVAIADGVNGMFFAGAVMSAMVSAGCVITIFSNVDKWGEPELKAAGERWLKKAVPFAVACAIVSALLPTTDRLLRAFLMVEGSKLVTAENAEKATGEIVKRIDKALELMTGTKAEDAK
jgi:hypothetical protein